MTTVASQPATRPSRPVLGLFRRVRTVVSTLATVLVVIVAALALMVAIAVRSGPSGQYTLFGHPVLSVMSGSMTPVIRTGDLIYDDRLSPEEAVHLHVGQIITFLEPGSRTVSHTHRIYAIKHVDGAVAYETKGDANNAPDSTLVNPSRIVGLYAGKIPFGAYVLHALHQPGALVLLLASPLLWLLSGWLFGLAREAREHDDDLSPPDGGQEVGVM